MGYAVEYELKGNHGWWLLLLPKALDENGRAVDLCGKDIMSMTIRQEKSEKNRISKHVEAGLIKEAVRGEVRPPAAAPVIFI